MISGTQNLTIYIAVSGWESYKLYMSLHTESEGIAHRHMVRGLCICRGALESEGFAVVLLSQSLENEGLAYRHQLDSVSTNVGGFSFYKCGGGDPPKPPLLLFIE